jgi:peptide/nickel transport system substrate-binding protein
MQRRSFLRALAGGSVALMGGAVSPQQAATQPREKVLKYGISMVDIPLTTGQPDRGAGGYQFSGHTIYDPLVGYRAGRDWCAPP